MLSTRSTAPFAAVVRPSARSLARGRYLATATEAKTQPCTRYLEATHPDGEPGASTGKVSSTLARFNKSTLATYSRPQLLFTRGRGLDLWAAVDGGSGERQYLDFSSGIAVNSLGHADPEIAKLAQEQAGRLVHASNLYHNEWSGELASLMVEKTHEHGGLGFEKGSKSTEAGLKVFLANSGTEANEAALKFARKAGKVRQSADASARSKTALVCFTNAFHGRTMGALSVTPNPKYQRPFDPLLPNVRTGEYNSDAGLYELIGPDTAGVIVEPVQGEGGIFPARVQWLRALRKRCDEVGALLIYDEIQCGLFRTGTLWAHSDYPTDCHPDLVTMAKPLANGFPIGAVLMRDSVADAIQVGDHGTTFGGGPLTSRIAHHVLTRLSSPTLLTSLSASSSHLFSRLRALLTHFPDLISNEPCAPSPRGRGLLVGMSMHKAEHAGRLVALARHRGLLVLSAGKDAVRITPSLIVTKEEVDKAMDILESALLVLRSEQ